MPNAETKTSLALRRDGKGKSWSHIRQAWFVEFPEELVRQQYVCKLVNDYDFSLEQMDEEIATQHGCGSVEADIVIWRTARDKADEKPPLIVAECKADNVTIDKKDYGQGRPAEEVLWEYNQRQVTANLVHALKEYVQFHSFPHRTRSSAA